MKLGTMVSRARYFVLVLVLAGALSSSCRDKAPPSSGGVGREVFTTEAIKAAYEDNTDAADRRFRGAQLLIRGVVTEIGTTALDEPYVTLGQGGFPAVQAIFSRANRRGSVRIGQAIQVDCECFGIRGSVVVNNCRLF